MENLKKISIAMLFMATISISVFNYQQSKEISILENKLDLMESQVLAKIGKQIELIKDSSNE